MNDLSLQNPIEKYRFIHHFVPHPVHKHRATLLSSSALFVYSLILVMLFGFFKTIPIVAPGVLGYASDINTNALLADTNRVRTEHNLPPLKMNSSLSLAAQKKAEHMFAENYWAHVSPSGVKPWDFILAQGYDYSYAGENLAKNFDHSGDVVTAWIESPSHRENLLGEHYTEIGFAVVNGVLDGYETTLVVQMFGSSRTPSYTASASDTPAISPSPVERNLPEQKGLADINETPISEQVVANPQVDKPVQNTSVLPYNTKTPGYLVEVQTISKFMLIAFLGFVFVLLALDIWYSEKKGIPKLTGHTLVHLSFLIVMLFSVWLVLSPGRIL